MFTRMNTQKRLNMNIGNYTKPLRDDLRKGLFITLTLLFVCPGVWGQDVVQITQESDFGSYSGGYYTLGSGTYKLSASPANISISYYLYIASGSTVTIDLNGQTLSRGRASAGSNGFVIQNDGTLVIQDSGTGGTIGSITGGFNSGSGGGIYNNGNLTITGGSITGNRATVAGAGVYNTSEATFNVSGKVDITGNTQSNKASNVYLPSNKKINIIGNLDANTRIGVTMNAGTGLFTYGLSSSLTSHYTGSYTNFTSDVSSTTDVKMMAEGQEASLVSNWEHIQDLIDHAPNYDANNPSATALTIQLESGKTYTALSTNSNLNIPSGKNITIDLNGQTLDRGLNDQAYATNGNVFTVASGSSLTITGSGYIQGGKNNDSGGAFINNGTLTINSGTIQYCYANGDGGGIYNDGTVYIQGGEFLSNGATFSGGGICNTGTGEVNILGGTIQHNRANQLGAQIYNAGANVNISGGTINTISDNCDGFLIYNASGTLDISGGTFRAKIYNSTPSNISHYGIYFADGVFNLSGNPSTEIYFYNSFSVWEYRYYYGIFLPSGKKINITGQLTGSVGSIGIVMSTPGIFTNDLSGKGDINVFHADENYRGLSTSTQKYIEISQSNTNEAQMESYWHKLQTEITNASGSTIITLSQDYKAHSSDGPLTIDEGKTIEINLNNHTLDRNLTTAKVDGCVIKNNGTLTISGYGTIEQGYNDGHGGGIYNNGTLSMKASSDNPIAIENNNITTGHNGAGIYNTTSATLAISGWIRIYSQNLINRNNSSSCNVYLPSGKKITILDGGLNINTRLGITHADDRIVFTVGLNWPRNQSIPFSSDLSSKSIGRTSDGNAIIGPTLTLTPHITGSGSLGITSGQKAIEGAEVTFSVSSETGNIPFSLSYTPNGGTETPITVWDDGSYSFIMPNNPVTVNATFRPGGYCGDTDHEHDMKYYLAVDDVTLSFITKPDPGNPSQQLSVAMNAGYTSEDEVPWNIEGQKITYSAVSMSDHVTSISPYAFFGSSISSITIPSSVATIGAMALGNCQNLSAITSSSSSFYAGSNVLYTAGQTELVCYPAGLDATSYILPNTVITVRDGAFAYNTHLTTINVEPGGTPSPSFSAPNGVLYNAGGTILYCYPARKEGNVYDVASTVTEIKPYAFHNNNLLKVVNFCEASVPTSGKEMFENHNNQLRIMVKNGQGANYKGAPNWINYKDIIFEMDMANAVASLEYTTHKCTEASLYPDLNSSGVTITVDGQTITLRKDIDYTIEKNSDYYTNNTAVGTATVAIKGAGGYAGTNKALTFTITRELIISGADNRYTYFASEDLTLPSHLTAWIYPDINWGAGVMTPTSINYIPANVPVILYRDGTSINETLYLTAYEGGTPPTTHIKYYRGTATAQNIDGLKAEIKSELSETAEYIYVLRGENFVRATSGELPAKHCYLYKPIGTAAPSVLTTTFSAISGGSYKIETLNASNGSVTIKYDNSGTPTNVIVDNTQIPAGNTVTLTITPNAGYYLSALQCEEVTTLGVAMAPARRADRTQEIHKININSNYEGHFAGDYTFPMPRNNVIVTATFVACTSINSFDLTLDGDNVTKTYDRSPHTVTLKNSDTPLEKGTEYGITTGSETYTNVSSNLVTLTGWGRYNGTKSATLSITAKTLNVTADAKSKTYADPDPTLTYTTTGLESGDENVIIGALSRNSGQDVGTYTINIGTLKAGSNYNISYTPANLTINQRDISNTAVITLNSVFMNYDGSTPFTPGISSITDPSSNDPLVLNTDYNAPTYPTPGVYSQTDHIQPDIYTISVSFKGNYTGTATKEYQVRPKITMSGNNVWYTYYNPTYNMKMPDGVKAYTISDNTETQIILSPNNDSGHGYIKAATPMLLYYTGASTDIYPELVKTDDSHLSTISSYTHYHGLSDATVVTSLPEYNTKDIWILVNNQFVRTDNGSIPANRCYLALVKNSITVPHFAPAINFGGLTGIDEPRDKKENVELKIYNLNGQRVQNPTKGLYIVNGKKVIIK